MKKSNTNLLNKLLVLSACASPAFGTYAEEFVPNPDAQLPVDQVVAESIKEPFQATYTQSPRNILQDYIVEKGWADVYQTGKFRIMKIGETSFSTRDPKRDPQFMIKRSNATTIATLNAKVEIIKTIRSEMSASDQIIMPGSDIQAKLDVELIELEEKIANLEYEIGDVEGLIDDEELNQIGSLTWENRAEALADAMIKKLDSGFDPNTLEKEQKEKFDRLMTQAKTLKSDKDELIDRAESLKGSIAKESKTSVEVLAEMPLYGTLTLATEERFDPERQAYEVVVLVVWSQKNELRTRSIITGQFQGELNTSQKELLQHITNNKSNLPSMIGSSLFKDSTGNLWVIGVGASEVRGNNIDPIVGKARIQAQQQVAVGLFANINTKAEYDRIVRETVKDAKSGTTESVGVESFASTMTQEFQNRTITGVGEVYGYRMKHPISDKEIFISVYAVSAASTEAIKHIEKHNYRVNRADIKAQKQSKATKFALKGASEQAKSSPVEPVAVNSSNTNSQPATKPKSQLQSVNSGYRVDLSDDDF
ncbi:hypothetical protein EDB60_110144 [Vibrio crassostreae]|uniref:hypothetical protein n=1 Tax=Vibrio crassostreae TaxID=246167 RepID=UPI00104CAF96|nr:hypothetical protein [Vibrio crassostreae]TCN66953.1 hypothetical protein EDB60_110144 [Vibrio crassostreae]TCW20187.1 hypothetical protein EDB48_104133 [Vibrio crassostreae]CAK3142848.1 exported hypothetical protein [Vibrio crassostreae]CAK3156763.1 exported hypothetical protein [Vibrio crassostreae]CAK3348205.1 exported hypothetical protein [Vibrio crassostreae]